MIEINGRQYALPCSIPDLPEQIYHEHWAVGSSGLRDALVSPATHRYGGKTFDRAARWVGTGLHRKIGDEQQWTDLTAMRCYVPVNAKNPDGPEKEATFQHGALKRQVETWLEQTNGAGIVLSKAELALVEKMSDAIWRYEWLPDEIKEGPLHVEWSIFWRDPRTGIVCKCRPDLWYHSRQMSERLVIDLKTSHTDVSPKAWGRVSADHGYHIQDAFYRRGLDAWYRHLNSEYVGIDWDRFKFLVVGKQPVPPVAMYHHTAYQLERADEAIDEALALIRWCKEKDYWPGDFEPAATVQPQWQSYEHNDTMSRARNYRRRVAPESFPKHELEEMA